MFIIATRQKVFIICCLVTKWDIYDWYQNNCLYTYSSILKVTHRIDNLFKYYVPHIYRIWHRVQLESQTPILSHLNFGTLVTLTWSSQIVTLQMKPMYYTLYGIILMLFYPLESAIIPLWRLIHYVIISFLMVLKWIPL